MLSVGARFWFSRDMVTTPPLDAVTGVLHALQTRHLTPAVGGSGLLVALGLAEIAHDWDVTVDAADSAVITALNDAGMKYRDGTSRDGIYATRKRYVVDGGNHDVDLLVYFALRGPNGVVRLPNRVTGWWHGLPLADPGVWAQAYRLLNRPAKAEALEHWLAANRP